ncbi:MAG: peptidase U32 family protein [Planctomycetota bacterium]
MPRPELMAPAGDAVCLRVALQAGADAVYFGLEHGSMRAAARNLAADELVDAVATCHRAGARAYLALNCLVQQQELDQTAAALDQAAAAGVDMVIAADAATMVLAAERGLSLCASTQLSIANATAVRAWHQRFGLRRIVLARECSLDDLIAIRQQTVDLPVEYELFAHGAMCVALSGRCLLSQFTSGHSGNRGACRQPCRRRYRIIDAEDGTAFLLEPQQVLSPEDLCTIPFIEQLLAAGPHALKLEGRMRKPEYVDTVVRVYRAAIDTWYQRRHEPGFPERFAAAKRDWMAALARVYNRGFSTGFLLGRPLDQWTRRSDNQASHAKQFVGPVVNYYRKPGVAEVLVQSHTFARGEELLFLGATTGLHRQRADSLQVAHRPVERAGQSEHVAVATTGRVRRGDQVYVIRRQTPATGAP